MKEDQEDEMVDCNIQFQVQITEDAPDKKAKPPNKRKFDEEMLALNSQIKEKESELERLRSSGSLHISKDLNNLRAEKSAKITRRREIDEQLERINNKILPEKMKNLNQLELSLYYKSEERINAAIQRLEWNLKAHSYKLSEEKKIVSEIDGLKRSKKTLGQYLTLKQEIGVVRDQLRHMREERDTLFRSVSQIKSKEEKLKTNMSSARSSVFHLKKAIDALYESRRTLMASFRRQKDEYHEVKERQKQEGLRRKESFLQDKMKRIAEKEAAKVPFEEELHLCNTLISYLGRFNTLPVSESSADSTDDPEFAEEIDDGQYVLLKKTGGSDGSESVTNPRKLSRRNRRSRKQSMVKQMTHTPEVVNQFLTLNLVAPATTADIGDTLDKLATRKAQYEQDQATSSYSSEAASDAGISATESLICEMSRQVSKTESSEEFVGAEGSSTGEDQVDLSGYTAGDESTEWYSEGKSEPRGDEERGAVGGAEVWGSQDGTGQNSDSTVEGDSGSVESQTSVCDAGRQGSSDSVGGAVGGEPALPLPVDSMSSKPARPTLLYSEMLNMPRPESALRKGGQTPTSGPMLSPRMPKHPPLSSTISSPANLYPATSPQQVAQSTGKHSASLDSGGPRQPAQKLRETSGRGNRLGVGGREVPVIHRRSTFSGRGRGQEKMRTAVERRETFSGQKKKQTAQAGDPTPCGQLKSGNVNPWKSPDTSVGRANVLPNRPRDLIHSGSPSSSMPPLSASWSGVARGSFKSAARSSVASYSSVASTPITPSPSFPSPRGLHTGDVPAQGSLLSPSSQQHRVISARASAPSLGEIQVPQKIPLAARPSLPQCSPFSLSPSQSLGEPQVLPPSPTDIPSGLAGLADNEQDFPPLSLSASMSSLPRRNSSNSSFSVRSGNSAVVGATTTTPHDTQLSSVEKQDSRLGHLLTKKSDESVERNGGSGDSSLKKSLPHTGLSCDTHSADQSALAVVTLSDPKVGGLVTVKPTDLESKLTSSTDLLPTDKAFTARWIADLSPPTPKDGDNGAQTETRGEWIESTHF